MGAHLCKRKMNGELAPWYSQAHSGTLRLSGRLLQLNGENSEKWEMATGPGGAADRLIHCPLSRVGASCQTSVDQFYWTIRASDTPTRSDASERAWLF